MNIKTLAIPLSILLFLAVGYLLLKQGREVIYEGVVVDAKTGLPISGAKVVITTFPYAIWDASPTNTGTITKDDGSFSMLAPRDYWISKATIASRSENGLFLRDECGLSTEDGLLSLKPLPDEFLNIKGYSYKHFSGGWGGGLQWDKDR